MLKKIITHSRLSRHLNSGQAIVLIALAAMGLIAIMGLSIDGGRVLLLQRRTQNATDAAVLAATRAMCRGDVNYVQAGLNAAAANGFDNDGDTNTVSITLPTNASITIPAECQGCYLQAVVKGNIPGTFISMFYGGPLEATSKAVAACNPNINTNPPSTIGLRAMWAIGNNCNPANVEATGSSSYVSGGFHSNGDVHMKGSGVTVIGPASYAGSSDVDPDDVSEGGYTPPGPPQETILGACHSSCFEPPIDDDSETCVDEVFPEENPFHVCDKKDDPMALNIADYAPGGAKAQAAGSAYHSYTGSCSGGYSTWLASYGITAGGTVQPGLYYSTCGFDLGGMTGTGTFVTTGDIKISKGGFDLTAYQDDLLFFTTVGSNSCNGSGGIKISGSSNHFTGNIYAPHSEVDFSGAKNTTAHGCIVAWGINFSGSNNQIICNPTDPAFVPSPGIGITE